METSVFPTIIEEKIRQKGKFEIITSALFLIITLSAGIISFVITTIQFKGKKFPSFLVYPNCVVSLTKGENWYGIAAGVKPLDTVISINGQRVKEGREIYEITRTLPYFTVKVKRDGEIVEHRVISSRFSNKDYVAMVILPFIVGLGFLIIGGAVYYATNKDIHVLLFFVLSILVALFFFTYISTNFDHLFYRLWVLYPLFGAVGVHLFGIFPVEHPYHCLKSSVIIFIYTIAFIFVALLETSFSSPDFFKVVFKTSTAFMGITFLGLIYIFFGRLKKTVSPLIRRKIRVLFFTMICASSIAALWSMMFPFTTPFLGTERGFLLSLIFPAITAYAVLKYNVFDIDRFVRTGLIFGMMSIVLIGVYLAMIIVAVLVTEKVMNIEASAFNMAIATLTVAVIFHPLRIKVKELLLSTFYREELKFKRTLEEFFDSPKYFERYTDIVRRLVRLFEGELGITPFSVFIRELGNAEFKEITPFLNSTSPPISEETKSLINSSSVLNIKKVHKIRENADDNFEKRMFLEDYRILIPLYGKKGVFTLIFIGERLPGEMYSPEELKYLEMFAERLSPILENALMYEEMMRKEQLALVGEMASIMIHDIKNPMGIIRAAVETLKKRKKFLDPKEEELFSIVKEEISRMDTTVRKILSYAKYEAPSISEENIEEIIKEVETEFTEMFRERRIKFSYVCNCDDPTLLVDKEKIKSLFSNLISNAIESIKENGNIKVEFQKVKEDNEKWFIILVKDDGEGIPPGMESQIFKPFFSTKTGGTGLGLAICERIVKDHGGSIKVCSGMEKGAVFHIKIPIRREKWRGY